MPWQYPLPQIGPATLRRVPRTRGDILDVACANQITMALCDGADIGMSAGKPGKIGLPSERRSARRFEQHIEGDAALPEIREFPIMIVKCEGNSIAGKRFGKNAKLFTGIGPLLFR